jgi:hypothetical protein
MACKPKNGKSIYIPFVIITLFIGKTYLIGAKIMLTRNQNLLSTFLTNDLFQEKNQKRCFLLAEGYTLTNLVPHLVASLVLFQKRTKSVGSLSGRLYTNKSGVTSRSRLCSFPEKNQELVPLRGRLYNQKLV